MVTMLKQESASLVTTKIIATTVTPESGLVQEGILMTPTRVETTQDGHQIMEKNTSKPWVTFWSSDKTGLVSFQDHSRKLNVVKQIKHGGGNKCFFDLFCCFLYQVFTQHDSFAINT